MKISNTFLTILLLTLLSSPSWSTSLDDLVERDGVYYPQFSDVPFTGGVTGKSQGSLENGKKVGDWVRYHYNGQLSYKGNYNKGSKRGLWVTYFSNGQLLSKGNYYYGWHDGAWVFFNDDGTPDHKYTGTYKHSVKISD
tara:strand:- start:191 stop:607 length:417 start_codon:yes stop_codon:yes gene_type:complete